MFGHVLIFPYLCDIILKQQSVMSKYVCLSLSVMMLLCVSSSAQNVSIMFAANSLRDGDSLQSQSIFAGHTDYLLGGRLIEKEGVTKRLLFDGGYVNATVVSDPTTYGFTPYYYNMDHLGNNREVVDSRGDVRQLTNYYPFGAPYADPVAVVGSTVQQYKYNGKELDVMHGLNTYDYGARQYYSILGRWDRMDSLCEKYYDVSPYVYCHDNPIMLIDEDGMDDYFSSRGKFLFTNGTGARMYIRQGNRYVDMKYFNLRNSANRQVVANIVGHYANSIGVKYKINGGTGDVGISTLHKTDGKGRVLAGTTKGNIYIKMTNGYLDEYMYDSNQLKGTLRHENEHKKRQDNNLGSANALQHAQIILKEIQGPEFEDCSEEYQNGQINQFNEYLRNTKRTKENSKTLDKLYKILFKFRKLS